MLSKMHAHVVIAILLWLPHRNIVVCLLRPCIYVINVYVTISKQIEDTPINLNEKSERETCDKQTCMLVFA